MKEKESQKEKGPLERKRGGSEKNDIEKTQREKDIGGRKKRK